LPPWERSGFCHSGKPGESKYLEYPGDGYGHNLDNAHWQICLEEARKYNHSDTEWVCQPERQQEKDLKF
jgi:hypothetical protein